MCTSPQRSAILPSKSVKSSKKRTRDEGLQGDSLAGAQIPAPHGGARDLQQDVAPGPQKADSGRGEEFSSAELNSGTFLTVPHAFTLRRGVLSQIAETAIC